MFLSFDGKLFHTDGPGAKKLHCLSQCLSSVCLSIMFGKSLPSNMLLFGKHNRKIHIALSIDIGLCSVSVLLVTVLVVCCRFGEFTEQH